MQITFDVYQITASFSLVFSFIQFSARKAASQQHVSVSLVCRRRLGFFFGACMRFYLGSPELRNAPLIFENKNSETFSEF
jgi:hypothetical protein